MPALEPAQQCERSVGAWVLWGLQPCAAESRLFAVSLSHLQGVLFHEGQSFGVVPPVSDAAG